MITCERCKNENLDGAQYCDDCGAPLRPNAASRSGRDPSEPNSLKAEGDGQNGFHSPAAIPEPELAAGQAAAAVNLSSSGGSKNTAHAKLVIERGRSVGKQFTLSAEESQIGRWDADGGVYDTRSGLVYGVGYPAVQTPAGDGRSDGGALLD